MSLQEIEQAIAELPEHERAELVRRISQSGGVESTSELIRRRHELAEAAAPHWRGGDGLDYQLAIRAEWDDRPGFDD